MISLVSEGLTSTDQYSLTTQGLKSGEYIPLPTPILIARYPATYEGVVNIIADRLITTVTPQYRPYGDTWEGIINAMKDSKGVGSLRPQGYRKSYQGFIEVTWDKFMSPSGMDVKGKYPFTFEGCVQVLRDALIPDNSRSPYLDSFQGMIDVVRDSTV